MIKKIINIFLLISFFSFFFLITKHYFSEENIVFTNKSRSSFLWARIEGSENLPLLKNDTNNVIINITDLDEFKKKRKKRPWEKLISGKDE